MLVRKSKRNSKHRRHGSQSGSHDTAGDPLATENFWRLRVLLVMFLAGFAVIAARLGQLQGSPDSQFSHEDRKHIGEISIHKPRGDIFDRSGRVLATDRTLPSLSANPSAIENYDALVAHLRRTIDLTESELERLTRTDAQGRRMKFVYVRRWMTDEELDALGPLESIPGGDALRLHMEPVRFYPERTLAAHVLGFANRQGDGGEGVELSYDKYLRSEAGRRISRVDSNRNTLSFLTLEYEPPKGGYDVHLTIDSTLQYELEKALDEAMIENKAPRAMGILMDPKTGAVLAMASRPAFDPNRYNEYDAALRKNRAMVDVFEPGSAFKVVPAAAALDLGLITPTDLVNCEGGSFNPYGHRIRDVHKLDIAPFSLCFAQSSNIAIIKVAALLGAERFDQWIRAHGFGSRTNIDLPGESPGIYRPTSQWSRLSMGSLPMGQEIAVTMPQLATAYSIIANGGYHVQPHVVDRVTDESGGVVYQFDGGLAHRVMSDATARTMRELCHLVVQGENTGRKAAIAEYRVGGKTGTAQIARADGRGYLKGKDEKYTTVFAGFAPVNDPKLVCVIVVPEPNIRNHYGGYVCGPIFKRVVRDALIRMNVPPDPMVVVGAPGDATPAAHTSDADTVAPHVELADIEPVLESSDLDDLKLMAAYEDSYTVGGALPAFVGQTKRRAIDELTRLGIAWDAEGAGRVVYQEPPAGTPLNEVHHCRLVFARPGDPIFSENVSTGHDD